MKGLIDRAGLSPLNDSKEEEKRPETTKEAQSSKPSNIIWVCDMCPFQSKSENVIKEHKDIDHSGPQLKTIYLCDLCKTTCNSQTEFKKHAEDHHKVKKCNDCGFKCTEENSMSAHRKKKHDRHSNKFSCDRCGNTLSSLQELDLHIQNTHN